MLLVPVLLLIAGAHAWSPLPFPFSNYTTNRNTYIPKQSSGEKRPHQQQRRTCPIRYNGFHLLTDNPVPYPQAEEACAERGLLLARLDDFNMAYGLEYMAQCTFAGWIASYNGLNAEPCAALVEDNGPIYFTNHFLCFDLPLAPLCQEPEVVILTETSTVTTTISFGTETVSTQVTRHPVPPPQCPDHRCDYGVKDPDSFGLMKKAEFIQLEDVQFGDKETSCNECNVVCPILGTDFRIIRRKIPSYNAEEECARYGWSLADVTSGQIAQLQAGTLKCSLRVDSLLFVRSFNGVTGTRCIHIAAVNGYVEFGQTVAGCFEQIGAPLDQYAVCQCTGPNPTGFGPDVITTPTLTTTTTTNYEAAFVPETTVTVTSTVCENCHAFGRIDDDKKVVSKVQVEEEQSADESSAEDADEQSSEQQSLGDSQSEQDLFF